MWVIPKRRRWRISMSRCSITWAFPWNRSATATANSDIFRTSEYLRADRNGTGFHRDRAVAPERFGAIKRPVRGCDHCGCRSLVRAAQCRRAHAYGEYPSRRQPRVRNRRLFHPQPDRFRHRPGPIRISIRKTYREFLAAIARHQIRSAANNALQSAHYLQQARVAMLVALAVVKRFEVIDIDHQQRQGRAFP